MNTSEFSISRFGMLLKSELQRNLKDILILTGVILGLYLLSPMGDGHLSTSPFIPYIGFAAFALPFFFYKHLFHTTKGVAFGQLPASQTEKFLSIFCICTIIVPIAMLVFSWIVSLAGVGLTGRSEMMFDLLGCFTSRSRLGFFDSTFWSIVGMQSVSVWGVCFFKSGKFGKTLLSLLCVSVAGMILVSMYGYSLHHSGALMNGFYIEEFTATRLAIIFDVFISIVVPVGLWAWSFFKIRRQQF
ncbi:MAG: hypothetical protein NC048_02390 [Bacteroides sp.]|nr:hypothetical protein [Ruminococcus flavefaciens]MCM1554326.1 hypothetical protein [Bacteroides sp.]